MQGKGEFPENILILDHTLDRGSILNLYANSMVVVYPSLREGLGLTFIEADWFGKKVISTDFPPMNEYRNTIPVKVEKFVEVPDSFVPLAYCDVRDLGDKMETFLEAGK